MLIVLFCILFEPESGCQPENNQSEQTGYKGEKQPAP